MPPWIWYAAQVLRAEMRTFPSGSGSIELMWNQSHALELGAEVSDSSDADVVEAVPFPAHEAALDVDRLDGGVEDHAVARPADRREIAADRVVGGDVGDAVRSDLEVVQVRLQPVAARDGGDRLVVGVHDDVLALAEAEREHAPPPPGQVALALVALHAQIVGGEAARELVEPDELPLRRVDQRAVLAGPGPVGQEDVAGRGIAVGRGDGQDRRLDAGQRGEALVVGGRRRRVREPADGRRRIRGVDAEAEGDRLARAPITACTTTCSPGVNGASGTKLAPSPCE